MATEFKGTKVFRTDAEREAVERGDILGMFEAAQTQVDDVMTDICEARIIQDAVKRCFLWNAPLHVRKCKDIVKLYTDTISKYNGFVLEPLDE